MRAAKAGVIYFAIVFAAGFVLGTVRTLMIIPLVGELAATLAELPFMIGISWFACRTVLQRWPVPPDVPSRAIMGVIALALLLAGEALISITLGGLSLQQHLALYATAPILLGLAGQLVFAGLPLWLK